MSYTRVSYILPLNPYMNTSENPKLFSMNLGGSHREVNRTSSIHRVADAAPDVNSLSYMRCIVRLD
jgi:hypothetical protein